MKQYKHIKTGDIATLRSQSGYGLNRSTIGLIPAEYIENSSDWKEIIQKDYEILSFNSYGTIYRKKSNGKFAQDKYILKGNEFEYSESDFELKNELIHSIKRLSDNKIFTVGDEILWANGKVKIDAIEIVNNKLEILHKGVITTITYVSKLEELKKPKKPLFTTEDGVDIYEGNEYFVPQYTKWNTLSGEVVSFIAPTPSIKKAIHTFSTKEKSEEYILMNKPCLSVREILDLQTTSFISNFTDLQKKKLIELVKSKLEE